MKERRGESGTPGRRGGEGVRRLPSNFLCHFRDVTTGTPGTGREKVGGGGLYMTTKKQARTVCV